MTRRCYFVALMASVLTVLLAGATGFAQGPGSGGPRGRGAAGGPGGPGAGLLLRGLNLTEAQQQQVRQLAEQYRTQNRALIEQVRQAEQARRDAVEATPFDEGRIRTVMQQLAEAQTELAVQQARLQSEIYGLLTPEQQQQVQKLRAEREARLKRRQDRLQQRGPRPQA